MTLSETWRFYRWVWLRWKDCGREILETYHRMEGKNDQG